MTIVFSHEVPDTCGSFPSTEEGSMKSLIIVSFTINFRLVHEHFISPVPELIQMSTIIIIVINVIITKTMVFSPE